jgi:ribosomal protein S21
MMQGTTCTSSTENVRPARRTRYDRPRLRHDLKASAARSKALKKIVRSPHTADTGAFQRRLLEERAAATALCSSAAHLRGRCHRFYETPEEQAERVRPVLEGYAI